MKPQFPFGEGLYHRPIVFHFFLSLFGRLDGNGDPAEVVDKFDVAGGVPDYNWFLFLLFDLLRFRLSTGVKPSSPLSMVGACTCSFEGSHSPLFVSNIGWLYVGFHVCPKLSAGPLSELHI